MPDARKSAGAIVGHLDELLSEITACHIQLADAERRLTETEQELADMRARLHGLLATKQQQQEETHHVH